MKNISFLILIIGLFACNTTPEPNLQLSNPEAFAFDLGESWEINSSVKSKGFLVKEYEDEYTIKLYYFIDLISHQNDTLNNIYSDSLIFSDSEEIEDVILESQIEIDTSYGVGDFNLLYHVKDMFTDNSDTISVAFILSK